MRGSSADRAALDDVLAYAQSAGRHARDRNALNDEVTCHAVLYELAIVGASANRVSEEVQKAHPEIPWSRIVALRNILVHLYDRVDLDLVWDALAQLTDLEAKVAAVRDGITGEQS